MSRSPGARIAVLIVQTAEDFKPQRPWHVPAMILSGRLFKKNLTSTEAKHFARVFNDAAVIDRERDTWNHEWAIVVPCLRRKWLDHSQKLPMLPGSSLPAQNENEPGLTYRKRRCIQKAVSMLATGTSYEEVERRLSVTPGTASTWLAEYPDYAHRCREQVVAVAKSILQTVSKDGKGGGAHE